MAGAVLLLLGGLVTSADCKPKGREAARDVAALEKLVRLPVRPQEVWFGSLPRGSSEGGLGPTDWTLVAVMRFDARALSDYLKSAKLADKGEPRYPRKDVAAWFPPEVRAALQPLSEQHVRVKGKRYDGEPFALGTGPSGSFFVLDDAPFVILRRSQE